MRAPKVAQALNNMAADISTRVATLSPEQRQTLHLCAHGFSHQEAGEVMGCTSGAVKDRLIRVRQRLDASNTYEAVAMLYRADNLRLRAAAVQAKQALDDYQIGQAQRALQVALESVST